MNKNNDPVFDLAQIVIWLMTADCGSSEAIFNFSELNLSSLFP